MNILFDSLELIYGSSGKPFFLTDINGNILWKNGRCGITIIFTQGLGNPSTTEQVNIDGEVFSIMRAMVRSSDRKLFNLEISYDNGFAVMSSTFSLKPDTHKGMITDSFEMYCAKMYIESLGGQLSYAFYDEIGQIRLALLKANVAAFSSAVFTSDEKVCEKLAGIFMTDAAEQ